MKNKFFISDFMEQQVCHADSKGVIGMCNYGQIVERFKAYEFYKSARYG